MTPRGLVIGAPRSGSGKTTVTLALLAAFKQRGISVRAAKSGPDYIDPAFHAAATGQTGLNLDSWAMPPALLEALASDAVGTADLLIIEGAMGLFDGVTGEPGRSGAAADLAAHFRLPVLLILDVSGQSQSAAAVLHGFMCHDPSVRIAGVVLNRVGSERHRALVTEAITPLNIPVIGSLPRDATLTLPERHLGLVQASEHTDLQSYLKRLAEIAERHIDLDAVVTLAHPLASAAAPANLPLRPPGQRIALARDPAFSFVYPHLLDGWRRTGASIVPFSPLTDEAPPDDCDCCWLPGGYPELHAPALASARRFRAGLAHFAVSRPVHGECGGYMVLGEGLEDGDGVRHAMTGLLSHSTSFAKRGLQLGYRQATLLSDSAIGQAGHVVRGHEFHYAKLTDVGNDAALVDLADAYGRPLGKAGGRRGYVTGTFFHAIASFDAVTLGEKA
jgi:cobyrinic acid a,c-diamide synthase